MSDKNTRRGNRVYVTDRERESIHMLIDKMPYDEWRAFVRSGGNDPEEIEERNTWYVIKGEEDSYDSEISNRLRESLYSDDESLPDTTIQHQDHVLFDYDSSSEFEFEDFEPDKAALDKKKHKKKRKASAGEASAGKPQRNQSGNQGGNHGGKATTKTLAGGGKRTKLANRKILSDKTNKTMDNVSERKEEPAARNTRRTSNNSFSDRPAGKTRYEESIGGTVYVPKGYCTAAISRGKPFCSQCMLKPCVMEKDKSDFDNMWCNLEIIHCRPSRYIERKLRGLAHSKMVQYFGPTYVDNLPNNGVPTCFDARLTYYIDSDCESGDEPDGDDTDYGAIVRACIIKSKEKRAVVTRHSI